MFRQQRIYTLRKLSKEAQRAYGLRILVTRHWLRGIKACEIDFWLPDAGPSLLLLAAYRSGEVSEQEFLAWYEIEQRGSSTCRVVQYKEGKRTPDLCFLVSPIVYLRQLEENYGTVTLLCWEEEPDLCHRHHLLMLCEQGTKAISAFNSWSC